MAEDAGKGKPADDGKKVEAPKTLEEAIAKLTEVTATVESLQGKLKETTEESIKRKEKLRALDAEREASEASKLKEKGEFETLVKTLEPKAKRAEDLERVLTEYYQAEVADVPEEKRTLIPQGPVETQLSWLKTAKAQGLFTGGKPAEKTPPAGSKQGKAGDGNAADFLSWLPTDNRLTSLTPEQYAQWKTHNGRGGSPNRANRTASAWGG